MARSRLLYGHGQSSTGSQRSSNRILLKKSCHFVLLLSGVATQGGWENRMDSMIRTNLVKSKIGAIESQQRSSLQDDHLSAACAGRLSSSCLLASPTLGFPS
eukprot:5925719-Amphidinium_carterae.1